MKRSPPPARKTPLSRGTASRLKRTGLKPVSDRRRAEIPERAAVRAEVFERDGYRCQAVFVFPDVPCGFGLTPHHLWKEGQGGPYTVDNLVTLCAVHNDLVEDRPDIAEAAGLVRRPHG